MRNILPNKQSYWPFLVAASPQLHAPYDGHASVVNLHTRHAGPETQRQYMVAFRLWQQNNQTATWNYYVVQLPVPVCLRGGVNCRLRTYCKCLRQCTRRQRWTWRFTLLLGAPTAMVCAFAIIALLAAAFMQVAVYLLFCKLPTLLSTQTTHEIRQCASRIESR